MRENFSESLESFTVRSPESGKQTEDYRGPAVTKQAKRLVVSSQADLD